MSLLLECTVAKGEGGREGEGGRRYHDSSSTVCFMRLPYTHTHTHTQYSTERSA